MKKPLKFTPPPPPPQFSGEVSKTPDLNNFNDIEWDITEDIDFRISPDKFQKMSVLACTGGCGSDGDGDGGGCAGGDGDGDGGGCNDCDVDGDCFGGGGGDGSSKSSPPPSDGSTSSTGTTS